MKKPNKQIVLFILLLLNGLGFSSCDKSKNLSQAEIDDIKYLREEEKLAHDVYAYAYSKYSDEVFVNIMNSEQKHLNKMLTIINDYDLSDPNAAELGVFKDNNLQDLYDELILKVDSSLKDALIVGAIIEDVDIADIDLFISRTKKNDIIKTYEKLNCGSDNHMRAFTDRLSSLGYTYQPQFISPDLYASILAAQNGGCGK